MFFVPKTAADVEKFVQKYSDTSDLTLQLGDYTSGETLPPLTGLSKLTKLDIWDTYIDSKNSVTDYSSLAELTQVRELTLTSVYNVTDITFLKSLTQLTQLSIDCSNITDVTPITALVNLASTPQKRTNPYGVVTYWPGLVLFGVDESPELDLSPLYSMPNYDVSWQIPDSYTGLVGEVPEPELSEYEQLLSYGVTLTNYDVQYDIANSVSQFFYFDEYGVAELDDYYNWGYSGTESEFFVMTVTPGAKSGSDYKMGSYSDHWNVYADRDEFSLLFDLMKAAKSEGEAIGLHMICYIDPQYYEDLAKMATLRYFSYDIAGTGELITWS
jgi:hypothetical protein